MNDIPHINGYTIERLIASGGTAEVYRAIQQSSARPVALKILNAQQDDPSFTERFLKEGRLIAALQHPHIITIYEVGIDGGCHYIAMELVEGGDLDRQLQGRAFHPLRALAVLRDVATCLQFVHERGIIHRDVKPANVLFRQNGSLVLTDFGIAKRLADDVKLTQTGSAVGSPAYSSPEQSQGLALDVRTDIYSLGVMFLEMLLGQNPYKAETYANTAINHIQMPVPRLEGALRPYQGLVDRMLAKQPAQRFTSMQALLDYLAHPPQTPWYERLWEGGFLGRIPRARFWPRSALAWVGIVSTLLLLGLGGWFGWSYFQQERQVRDLLQKAEQARAQDRLLSPSGDSAIDYYRQVLALRPDHAEARQGIVALAQHYLELARGARDRQSPEEALRYVNRGLGIDPYSVPLIDLKAELERRLQSQDSGRSRTKPEGDSPGFLERLFN